MASQAPYFSYAFDTWHRDGTLHVCTNGDLWQRIVSPESDDARWSYFGPVLEVEPTQLNPKHHEALARCQDIYRDARRDTYRGDVLATYAATRGV